LKGWENALTIRKVGTFGNCGSGRPRGVLGSTKTHERQEKELAKMREGGEEMGQSALGKGGALD